MITNIFLSFFEISVSISPIVAVLLLFTSFLNKRYAAKWLYLIWIFIALRLLIPFSGGNGQSVIDMLSKTKNQTELNSEKENTDTLTDAAAAPRRVIVEIPAQMTTPIAAQSEKNNFSITLLDIAAFGWMIGSLFFISLHLISYLHYKKRVIKKGRIIKDTHILHQMYKLKRELNIKCTIDAVEFPEADSPMIIGFLKPVLVLPEKQYSSEELFFILKHELIHLKRGDVYLKLLFAAANAVHWFNPLIWIMQKEAAVNMELSCDERVTQGTDYAVRKAYTETLLSTLHKQCTKGTSLSTQFYGGKNIMKKRFENILSKKEKKNGISILICAVILTISFGTLVGCSVTKEDEMPATLFVGEGYSIYLTDDDWHMYAPDAWSARVDGKDVLNGRVQFWIAHSEDKTANQVREKLESDGYISENPDMIKQENEVIYKVRLNEFENDVWLVYYCYPIQAEKTWGNVLTSIVDTFTVSTND